MKRKTRRIKADLDSRIGKYYVNRAKGMNKGDAQIEAGFPDKAHASRIEKTKTYKEIEKIYYKDVLQTKISLSDIADEHIKNIVQDQDRGAKNKAIEMAMNKIEPDKVKEYDEEKVTVILRQEKITDAKVIDEAEKT